MQHLPKYVQSFNGDVPEQNGQMATLPERWEHGPSPYRADDFPGEQDEFSNVSGRPIKSGEQIYEQIYVSPYLDKLTIDLAGTLAREEKLGQGMQTDMLIIGLSATDVVGHLYGPRSAESVDALAKLDLWLGQLLAELEQRVGQIYWWHLARITAWRSCLSLKPNRKLTSVRSRVDCPSRRSLLRSIGISTKSLVSRLTFQRSSCCLEVLLSRSIETLLQKRISTKPNC